MFDMFNHVFDSGSKIQCDPVSQSLKVVIGRDLAVGDQAFITYGPHDNEFLLVEYGFIVADNPYDGVSLDHEFMTGLFPGEWKELRDQCFDVLRESNFLGDYQIGKQDISHRLSVALLLRSALISSAPGQRDAAITQWKRRAQGLELAPEEYTAVTLTMIKQLLRKALDRTENELECVSKIDEPRLNNVVSICQTKCGILRSCQAYVNTLLAS
jgi:hypothetical protein